ncbi:MAG: phosphate signaling complex protein PhoU, partial [Anaerolineaceae bacterium]
QITQENDLQINEKRFAIENAILITMATQQPMAHDLRLLASLLEIATELERMGDYAKGIGKVTRLLGDDSNLKLPAEELEKMVRVAVSMLHQGLIAFIEEDVEKARRIPRQDDEVDALYNKVSRFAVEQMMTDRDLIDHANYLMWVAHNIERMADRVVNICERTVFTATGELMEIDSSDDETDDTPLETGAE